MGDATRAVHLVAASVGFISLGLLWLTVLWGAILRLAWSVTWIRHATINAIHQTLVLIGLTLGVVHAAAQLAVPGGAVHLVNEFVPFTEHPDPYGVGAAVIGTELFIAITISVPLQRRIGYHRWRRLHTFAYLAYTLVTAHVLVSGSDVTAMPVIAAIAAAWAVTVLLRLATSTRMARLGRRVTEGLLGRLHGRQVTVHVDATRCARFGFCEQEAPEVFRLHGDGRLTYRPSVPHEAVEPALAAVRACPARAIMLGRLATSVELPKATTIPTIAPESGAPARPRSVR